MESPGSVVCSVSSVCPVCMRYGIDGLRAYPEAPRVPLALSEWRWLLRRSWAAPSSGPSMGIVRFVFAISSEIWHFDVLAGVKPKVDA